MKKVVCFMLAIIMMLSMTVTAFAAGNNNSENAPHIDPIFDLVDEISMVPQNGTLTTTTESIVVTGRCRAMKVMTLAEAIGGIDDDLVSGAIVYQPKRAKKWKHSKWAMWGAFAACLCLVVGVFIMTHIQTGQEQPGVESPAGQGCFNATVLEITDDSILVECYDSIVGGISVGKKIQVSTNNISSERVPNLKLGDNIRILYIGNVSENEKELLILENTISIFLLDENGEVIIEDVN